MNGVDNRLRQSFYEIIRLERNELEKYDCAECKLNKPPTLNAHHREEPGDDPDDERHVHRSGILQHT